MLPARRSEEVRRRRSAVWRLACGGDESEWRKWREEYSFGEKWFYGWLPVANPQPTVGVHDWQLT